MAIPPQYKPLLEKILDRSRSGSGKWNHSVEQFFQVADGHALLTYFTDPADGPVQISVTILNRTGEPVYVAKIDPDDPDYEMLSELNGLAKRSLESTAHS